MDYIEIYTDYLKIVGLAKRTIHIYKSIIVKYLELYPDPLFVNQDQIIKFLLKRGSARTVKQSHGALNHFYRGVLDDSRVKKVPQPKTSEFIPNILSQIEMSQLFLSIDNIKHEALLQLMYSGALRLGEILNLKVEDISKTENKIKIISGKGNKTAYVPIPKATKILLREYYKQYLSLIHI